VAGTRIVCRIVIENPLEKLPFIRPKKRCEDNFKMVLKDIDFEGRWNWLRIMSDDGLFDIRAYESSCSVATAAMFVLMIKIHGFKVTSCNHMKSAPATAVLFPGWILLRS
jgi:hypothetical protein